MPKSSALSSSTKLAYNLREMIAQKAAQLILEDGLNNYDNAKRKAARQLGFPEDTPLPNHQEITAAMHAHQNLFAAEDRSAMLRTYREQALRWLNKLAAFQPVLFGPLAEGIATEHTEITLELLDPDSKSLELFLLDQKIPFRPNDPPRQANSDNHFVQGYELEDAGVPIRLLLRSTAGRPYRRQEPKNSNKHTTINATKLAAILNETPLPSNSNLTNE